MRTPKRLRATAPALPTPALPNELHPKYFSVDQAWLVIKATAKPIQVEGDPTEVYVLQDAGSMYLFGNAFAPYPNGNPQTQQVSRLFQNAWRKHSRWPTVLILPESLSGRLPFTEAAARNGIPLAVVPDTALAVYVSDVQEAFEEHFGGEGAA
jgi:hypothetical protein